MMRQVKSVSVASTLTLVLITTMVPNSENNRTEVNSSMAEAQIVVKAPPNT